MRGRGGGDLFGTFWSNRPKVRGLEMLSSHKQAGGFFGSAQGMDSIQRCSKGSCRVNSSRGKGGLSYCEKGNSMKITLFRLLR